MDLLRPELQRKGIPQKDFKETLKLLLAFTSLVDESNPVQEVKDAGALVARMLDLLKKCFPRERGHEWSIQKFHAMTKMTYYMLKFGKARNFTGQVGECALKSIIKDHAEQTQ